MGRFEPAPTMEGAAASAIELSHEYARQHVHMGKRSDIELVLSPLPRDELTAERIATAVDFEGIDRVELQANGLVLVRFSDEAHREGYENWGMLDTGPFRIEDPNARPVRLLRRGNSAIDVIEIFDTTTDEQWRLLHGHKLDVIPSAGEPDRPELAGLGSVRTIDFENPHVFALYFNLDNPTVANADARRAIVRALDRAAIARAVCGSDRCQPPISDPPAPVEGALPQRLSLLVLPGTDRMHRAAAIVRHQLRAAGVDVEVRTVDMSTGVALFDSVDTAMALAPWSRTPESYAWFTTPGTRRYTLTGYANPEYDRAIANGDLELAKQLLDRDVPVVPLLHMRYFAVIDNRFCGNVHPTPTSWLWLADLRPCAQGETP